MPRLELTLRVDSPTDSPSGTSAVHSEESHHLRSEIYGSLGLRPHSHAWVDVPLWTPKGLRSIQTLIAERKAGNLVVGSATVVERLDELEEPASDWCMLFTRSVDDSFSLQDDYPSCKAGSLPNVGALNRTFVSQAFASLFARNGFTGLDLLRCATRGRKPAAPWYVALPTEPLGNGLDHPWFDRDRWTDFVNQRPEKLASSLDEGQSTFHQYWLRSEAASSAELALMLDLCPQPPEPTTRIRGLNFSMVPRYLSRAEPPTDCAYVPWGIDWQNAKGKTIRDRAIAVRRKVRSALLEEGLLKKGAFARLRSIAQPECSVKVLDGLRPLFPPMYTPSELHQLRQREPSDA
jgi:hypothetical protein